MQTTFPATIALRIAGLDRMKFNDIVARGYYSCAPSAAPRSPRNFSEADIIALVALGRLIDSGVTPRYAGPFACEVLTALRYNPNTKTVNYNRHADGNTSMWHDGAPDGAFPVLTSLVINIESIRQFVTESLAKFDEGWIQRAQKLDQVTAEIEGDDSAHNGGNN